MFSFANILTSFNLFFGCLAVLSVCQNQAEKAMLFLGLGLLCDFLDGFVARWMKQESELGIQLDSLADVVSFGVLPGFMLYILLMNSIEHTSIPIEMSYFAFIITVMASFRLARFNIEADGKVKDFQGLPVP
ncbi:MAG: CDP-alcohol phosphatidyltransferase family protein, partial [Saprospiraceae bacterium]